LTVSPNTRRKEREKGQTLKLEEEGGTVEEGGKDG
jgi:hypothetical protein